MLNKEIARSRGQLGERFAQKVYESRGFKIADKNIFNRRGKQIGEVDFIAISKDSVVFVEVKTRSVEEGGFGSLFEAITVQKRIRLVRTVKWVLMVRPDWQVLQPRIDFCGIIWKNLDRTPEKVIIRPNAIEDLN